MQLSPDEREQELEEAAEWVLRLDKNWSPQIDSEFRRWVTASPTRVAAFLVAKVGFQRVMELEMVRHILLRTRAANGIQTTPCAVVADTRAQTSRRSPRLVAAAVVGISVIAALCAAVATFRPERLVDAHRRTYVHAGRVRLGSDSTMVLGEDPRAEVSDLEGGKGTRVNLLQGTALFSGTHSNESQLQVVVSHAVIDVLGTVFEVRRDQVASMVMVKDGVVKVNSDCQLPQETAAAHDGKTEHEIVLGKGQSIVIPSAGCNGPFKVSDGAAEAATPTSVTGLGQPQTPASPEWIAFSAATIGEAVSAFNLRNSRHHLVVTDRALANRRIGGRFRTSDPEGFVEYLIHSLGARVTRGLAPDGSVVIKLFAPKKRISQDATPLLPTDMPHRGVQSS